MAPRRALDENGGRRGRTTHRLGLTRECLYTICLDARVIDPTGFEPGANRRNPSERQGFEALGRVPHWSRGTSTARTAPFTREGRYNYMPRCACNAQTGES
jgi:hypothetical protein